MLYVVEMDFTQPQRQQAWDAWYLEHVDILLSVPGFHTAQRFYCTSPCPAPYLAIYSVDTPAVFDSAPYRERGGRDSTGAWKPTMVNWDRNLYAGIERAPAVAANELLLLADTRSSAGAYPDIQFAWLTAVGLDRTVLERGMAVTTSTRGDRVATQSAGLIHAYRPLMPQRVVTDR